VRVDDPSPSRTLTANIRSRRGSKVAINLPIFVDKNTPRPFVDPTIPWERNVYPEDSGKFTLPFDVKNDNELMDYVLQRRRMEPHCKIMFTWMLWASGWDVAVSN
jgi:hypothetical protein